MKVYIGFSTSSAILARLIRFVTRSGVSHVYVRIPVPNHAQNLIFQASGLAVNLEAEIFFLEKARVVKEFPMILTPEKSAKLESMVLNRLGAPYSCKALVGMLCVLACRTFGKKIKNPFRDGDHSYVCVELAANLLDIEGAEEMTPQDLLDKLTAVI